MKVKCFEQIDAYRFLILFENGENKEVDLFNLIAKHISLEQLNTARIDTDWSCLEFNDGQVDKEPKTLYQFALNNYYQDVAYVF